MLHWDRYDHIGLVYTPVVFAAVFALGVWADPVDLFGVHTAGATRVAFAVAAIASLASSVRPAEAVRLVALVAGLAATLSRGLTIVVIGSPGVTRKAEIIGGSVWLATAWMVFAVWVLTVPSLWRRRRRRDRV